MAHAYFHAISSARHFGGKPEDYQHLHEFMDHTKSHLADCRHRLLLHNAWGIFLAEQVLGSTITRTSDNKVVPVRPLLEQHVVEDFGFIPSLAHCLKDLPEQPLEGRADDDLEHSQKSAHEFGGEPTDYLPIHHRLNAARDILADQRHQLILHNTWGITLLLRLSGPILIRTSDSLAVPARPLLEAHIRHDLGYIPSLEDMLSPIPIKPWMHREAMPISSYGHTANAARTTARTLSQ